MELEPDTPNPSNTTQPYPSQDPLFCGIPGFCSADSRISCADVIISQCSSCSIVGGVFLLIAVFLIFFAVVIGNAIIQACFVSSSTMRTKMDYVRLSLSVSDMLVGFQIVAVMIPNIIRTYTVTQSQLDLITLESINSPVATASGWLFTLTFISCMYHMVVLFALRLVAVMSPIKYRLLSNRHVFGAIAASWMLAAFSAAAPAIPSSSASYRYSQATFVYLSFRKHGNAPDNPDVLMIIAIIAPYMCTTFLLIATVVVLKMKRRKSDLALNRDQNNSSSYKREIRIINTLTIMYILYTGSVLPFAVMMILVNTTLRSCSSMKLNTPAMLSVLLAVGNSLVNVIVYNWRDDHFREVLRHLRRKCPCTSLRHNVDKQTSKVFTIRWFRKSEMQLAETK